MSNTASPRVIGDVMQTKCFDAHATLCARKKINKQGGTAFDDVGFSVKVGDDKSIILAETTAGDYSHQGSGKRDFVAIKLDGDGNPIWSWQVMRPCHSALLYTN